MNFRECSFVQIFFYYCKLIYKFRMFNSIISYLQRQILAKSSENQRNIERFGDKKINIHKRMINVAKLLFKFIIDKNQE